MSTLFICEGHCFWSRLAQSEAQSELAENKLTHVGHGMRDAMHARSAGAIVLVEPAVRGTAGSSALSSRLFVF